MKRSKILLDSSASVSEKLSARLLHPKGQVNPQRCIKAAKTVQGRGSKFLVDGEQYNLAYSYNG